MDRMSKFNASLRIGILTNRAMTASSRDRVLAALQESVGGLTYNIEQAIRKEIRQEGYEVTEPIQFAFGGRTD